MKEQKEIHYTHEEVRLALRDKYSIDIDRPRVSQQTGYLIVASPLPKPFDLSAEEEPIV